MPSWSWLRAANASLALTSFITFACARPRQATRSYPAIITIDAGPDRPVAGAAVLSGGRQLGVSDPQGRLSAAFSGAEGQVLDLVVQCPEGYRSPEKGISVALRAIADTDRRPEYHARCEPLLRTLVVAVRAVHGANLPVLYLGREVARTDRDGAAHVLVQRPSDDSVELVLDTHERPELRPRNPSVRFQVGAEDEVVVFEPPLQVPPPPKKQRPRPAGITNLSVRR